ncbi:hypothetical protein JTE90_014503 [Oedothorax gibbosus]|uniref:Uncharacterized protein n=1 Tax=Oedothorax gibbosus TaxID=931172 RepID=A0AAV6VIZ5_9ARAC|nr:hypothetical protein JTE90_014503 [Oedothorax gibbosus]
MARINAVTDMECGRVFHYLPIQSRLEVPLPPPPRERSLILKLQQKHDFTVQGFPEPRLAGIRPLRNINTKFAANSQI